MDAFGGGLGAHGEVCGAVVGGLAAVGLVFGRPQPGSQADMRMWKYAARFMRIFRKEIAAGGILCRDIAGVDWRNPDQVRAFREGGKFIACRSLTGKTAKLLGEILESAALEKSHSPSATEQP